MFYSLGYMKGEERFANLLRFPFAVYLSLCLGWCYQAISSRFIFFWELVGVSSYLLIGFYFDRPSAVAAAKKGFYCYPALPTLDFLIGILVLSFGG